MSVKEQSIANKIASIVRQIFLTDYKRKTVLPLPEAHPEQKTVQKLPNDLHRIQSIMQAVVQMDSHLKIPFSMYIGGYNYEEISQRLNVPVGTVHSRISLARQELQHILQFTDCQKN